MTKVADVVAENPVNRVRISPWWCVVRLPRGRVRSIAELSIQPVVKHRFELLEMPRWDDGSLRFVRLIATTGFGAKTSDPESGRVFYEVHASAGSTVHQVVCSATGRGVAADLTLAQTFEVGPLSAVGRGAALADVDLVGDPVKNVV